MVAGGSAVTTALQFCQQVLKRRGITPSMEEEADWEDQEPEEEPEAEVWLFLCNASRKDVVHRDQLSALMEAHPKFSLIHLIQSGPIMTEQGSQVSWRSGTMNATVLGPAASR